MKKALQNPFIVGTLAILAIFIVFRTTFKQEPSAAPPPVQQPPKSSTPKIAGISSSAPGKKIDTALAQWKTTTPDRNPFDATNRDKEEATVEIQATRIPHKQSDQPQLKLSAIWHDDKEQLAVINDKVLAKGETLLEYEIEDILSDQVILHGSGGRLVIGFRESPTSPIPKNQPLADSSK